MYELLTPTKQHWVDNILENMDDFLIDHAACERKASGMALSFLTHYPDKKELVCAMTDLALEELNHFRQVMQFIKDRNLTITPDQKDPYVNALIKSFRSGKDAYFLDRLCVASIVEKRGHERFLMVANALPESEKKLKSFYHAIAKSEAKHFELFTDLAKIYFNHEEVEKSINRLLVIEAEIVDNLAIRSALH